MQDISLKQLLEAGCHFGHQVRRWHPKARRYIYQARDGIHIIDLARTREGLLRASEFALQLGKEGKKLLFIGTKRQAKTIVTAASKRIGAIYLTQRWIGGFLTNWDEVKKNLEKIRKMRSDRDTGGWQQFPKHEQVQLAKELFKLENFYGGVAEETSLPDAVFIVDVRKENAAVREAVIRGLPIIGVVDTNSDPSNIDYPIPANDDAVGSIELLVNFLADSYWEGKKIHEKAIEKENLAAKKATSEATLELEKKDKGPIQPTEAPKEEPKKKRGRKKILKIKKQKVKLQSKNQKGQNGNT